MPIIEWSADLSVGHPDVDLQHQHLISQINQLHTVLRAPDPLPEVAQVLTALRGYVVYHFATEERLMAASGYPDADSHRQSHHWLGEQVHAMVRDFTERPSSVSAVELFEFLSDWLIHHIRGEDLAMRPWLAALAVAQAAPAPAVARA